MSHYYAFIRKDDDSDFGVEFPDLPGCITAGATEDEAYVMAEEALALHIAGMHAEGIPVPTPSTLHNLSCDEGVKFTIRVPVRPIAGRAQRVQITLDEYLLKEIDRTAKKTGHSRSSFLAAAAKSMMG